jgi:glutamyl-tRNA synthetase
MYRGRFAPSPTGDLHLGSAASALLGWLFARSAGGAYLIRVEDIDTPRVRAGVEAQQLDDLRWLGLDWDEGPDVGGPRAPYRQSERVSLYDRALAMLADAGLTYYCDCSRAEIARVASAPHAGDEGARYPGTCRDLGMSPRDWRRSPAVRLRVPSSRIKLVDRLQGPVEEDVEATVGDFVLKRGDGVYAYQLAVVVDDLAMGVTEAVRGADLLGSTARQALLAELLGQSPPAFAHHAMVVSSDGARLAKRARGVSLRDWRNAGVTPVKVLATIATAYGLVGSPVTEISAKEILRAFDPKSLVGQTTVSISPDEL